MKNKTKDIILSVLITIVAITIALIWIGTVENKKEAELISQAEEIEYKGQLKNSFMSACVAEGFYEYCDCSFETLYDKVGAEGLIKLDTKTQENNGNLTEETIDMIKGCFSEIK